MVTPERQFKEPLRPARTGLVLSLQNLSGRFGWLRLVPPHRGPLPQGEGATHPVPRGVEAPWIGESAAYDSPSPRGEGWGEGEETLRKPARLRTADEVNERRITTPHARRGAESLTVASRLPPHPGPLPKGEGTRHPALRRIEALWIVQSAAYGSPSPSGRGNTVPRAATSRGAPDWRKRGGRFSLSSGRGLG